jgi:cytohesin
MKSNAKRQGLLWMLCLITYASAAAADLDLRLVEAVKLQDKEAARALIKQRVDVNVPEADGAAPLHWAAHWNDLETADLLLRAGAAVNAVNRHGVTPLALASENGSATFVARLLSAGANPNAAQQSGETVLMAAVRSGQENVVRALLTHGANPNAITGGGQTALMWAVAKQHQGVVQLLTENGADVDAQSSGGFTPLMFAAQSGNLEAARTLIAAGANVNKTLRGGPHSLPLAVANRHTELALFLLEQGADPNAMTDGRTSLHLEVSVSQGARGSSTGAVAARSANLALIKSLLAHGANPNARMTAFGTMFYGQNPKNGAFDTFSLGVGSEREASSFWLAAKHGNVNVMRILLENGADPELTPDCQTTPLIVAAGLSFGYSSPTNEERTRMLASVKFLVEEVGADVNAVNEAQFTALHGAASIGADDIIKYLVEHGAKLDSRDWKGRTPFRMAQGHRVATDFREFPATAELLRTLGANASLGVDGHITEREDFGKLLNAGR